MPFKIKHLMIAALALAVTSSTALPADGNCVKKVSFVQLAPISGSIIFFDPSRITAVGALPYFDNTAALSKTAILPEIFFPLPSKLVFDKGAKSQTMTQVLGVFANAMPVKESVDDVLKLAGSDQFIQLTLASGATIWMRATAINWVMSQYPGVANPNAGCYVGLSLQPGRPTALKETAHVVRKLIETARNSAASNP